MKSKGGGGRPWLYVSWFRNVKATVNYDYANDNINLGVMRELNNG